MKVVKVKFVKDPDFTTKFMKHPVFPVLVTVVLALAVRLVVG